MSSPPPGVAADLCRSTGRGSPVVLTVTLVATLALAPLEGYLQDVNGNLSKLAPALFLLTWALNRLLGDRPVGLSHPVVWCAVGLVAIVLVSTALNLDNGYALLYLVRWVPFLVLVVALSDVLAHDVSPWVALYALVAGAALSGLGAVVSFAFLGSPRATGPLEDPNDLAYVLTAAVPMVLIAVLKARARALAFWGLVLVLLLVGAAATFSRGGFLAITAVLVWALARRLIPVRLLVAAGLLLVALVVPILLLARAAFAQALAQKQYIAATNVDTRLLRWHAAARMLGDHLLFGVGPGGFRTNYLPYSGFAELAERTPVAHEMYLEVGAELGLLGLVVFLGAIFAAFCATETAYRRFRSSPDEDDKPMALAALAVQGSLIAVCLSSIFLSEEYYMPLWAALSVAAALDHRSRRAT